MCIIYMIYVSLLQHFLFFTLNNWKIIFFLYIDQNIQLYAKILHLKLYLYVYNFIRFSCFLIFGKFEKRAIFYRFRNF